MKRIISLDILRGISIMGMVIFHLFMQISKLVEAASNDLGSVSTFELILIAVVAIFGHWQSFFLMISAIGNWYSMEKQVAKGVSLRQILKKQCVFGLVLYIFGFLREPFLNPWGIIGEWFKDGAFTAGNVMEFDKWTYIYRAETLSNIGLSVILSSLLFALLVVSNKKAKTERSKIISKTIVLSILAATVVFAAPTVQEWMNILSGGVDLQHGSGFTHHDLDVNYGYFVRGLLNSIGGREFPLFPNFGYFLVGCVIGVLISQEHPTKKILTWLSIIGIVLLLIGAAYWIFLDKLLETMDVTFHVHPTGFVIFTIGLQLIVFAILFRRNEFNAKFTDTTKLEKKLKRSRWIRRWGSITLTIFVFDILEFIPRGIMTRIYPAIDFRSHNQVSLPWTLLMALIVILMWEGIIRIWEKLKFVGTVEWVFMRLLKGKKNISKEDPLNIKGTLYEVEPILFISPSSEEKKEVTPLENKPDSVKKGTFEKSLGPMAENYLNELNTNQPLQSHEPNKKTLETDTPTYMDSVETGQPEESSDPNQKALDTLTLTYVDKLDVEEPESLSDETSETLEEISEKVNEPRVSKETTGSVNISEANMKKTDKDEE